MLTREGDLVMDPFNGAGATTKASWDLGRNSVGYDLETSYLKYAGQRLENPSAVREKQLLVSPVRAVDFVPRAGLQTKPMRHGAGIGARRAARTS
jgi:hypothetical protein